MHTSQRLVFCTELALPTTPQHLAKHAARTLAAFMISSARHSAIVLMLRNDASRAPVRRHVASLPADSATSPNASRVLARTAVDHGIHVDLHRILVRKQVDDLEGVLDNAHSHQLLAIVPAVPHHGAHQTLDNRALRLAEALLLPPALRVRQELSVLRLARDVVLQRDVLDLALLERPLAEQLRLGREARHGSWAGQGAQRVRETLKQPPGLGGHIGQTMLPRATPRSTRGRCLTCCRRVDSVTEA
eukprot:scaffold16610_cov135-Isochrysis_galbana.AAC.2